MQKNNTINIEEIKKFEKIADSWWDEEGEFKPLHKLNPYRIDYIKEKITNHYVLNSKNIDALKNIKILDIGCGGGLVSEALAKLGASVTAIDASEKNIKIAKLHAEKSRLEINYLCGQVRDIGEQFDAVVCLEVIEHVDNLEQFIKDCCKLLKPSGLIFFSTINRTLVSYAKAIIGAEYILKWLPRGTHDWYKFIKPSELVPLIKNEGLEINALDGFSYNILNSTWTINKDLNVNYMVCARRIK